MTHEIFWQLNITREPTPGTIKPFQPTEIRAALDLYCITSADERQELFTDLIWLDLEYRKELKTRYEGDLAAKKRKQIEEDKSGRSRTLGHNN